MKSIHSSGLTLYSAPWGDLLDPGVVALPEEFMLADHINGFGPAFENPILERINHIAKINNKVYCVHYGCYLGTDAFAILRNLYPNIDLRWTPDLFFKLQPMFLLSDYQLSKTRKFENFVCSFNGAEHISRQFLTAAIHRWGWYRPDYISKNFVYSLDRLDGNLEVFSQDNHRLWRKFFIGDGTAEFAQMLNSFGHNRWAHGKNVVNLEDKLLSSFVLLASESMGTAYYPHVSEKFLFAVVTKGLYLTYAQLGWHDHVESFYGFRKFKIFDYTFDKEPNPVLRLINMFSMLEKFSLLSAYDWHDLYLMEQDTIDFNYDHYFSNQWWTQINEKYHTWVTK